ncbi:protein kinase [Streptomyces luteireticuli]|uniref:serine/threonine-protein kinase n=1 Tax=Streptomyces luteireticuli TaxID=173858 RepID=UPI003557EF9C
MDTDGGDGRAALLAGRYRLVARLGSGGMGVVWRAFDEVLGREVAVKEVRAPQHVVREADVRVLYARLVQEARAAARIAHPCVITVHDVVEQEGRPWIVMELVRGRSLADVLEREGTLDPREAARVGAAVLGALRAAHASGVLHRDVKPGNVLLEDEGRVVLTDFGIALVEGTGTLTRTGDVIGSPDYLPPERALGQRPGTPSDLWSLGATLYAAVEGVSPFHRTSALGTLQAVVHDPPPAPRRAGPLAPLLMGLLVKDPHTRMGSAEAQRLLDAVASGRGPQGTDTPRPPDGYVPTALDAGSTPLPGTPRTPTYVPPPPPVSGPAANGAAGYGTPASGSPPVPPAGPAPTAPGYGPAPAGTPAGGLPTRPVPDSPAALYAAGITATPPVGTPPVTGRRPVWRLLAPLLALLIAGGGIAAALVSGDHGGTGSGPSGGGSSRSASPAPSTAGSPTNASDSPTPAPTTAGPTTPSARSPEETPGATATCPGGWVATCSPY